MTDTNSTIPSESFEAYMWDDLLEVFPQEVQEAASILGDNAFTYGDAEYTLIKGSVVERILYDAWDEVLGSPLLRARAHVRPPPEPGREARRHPRLSASAGRLWYA